MQYIRHWSLSTHRTTKTVRACLANGWHTSSKDCLLGLWTARTRYSIIRWTIGLQAQKRYRPTTYKDVLKTTLTVCITPTEFESHAARRSMCKKGVLDFEARRVLALESLEPLQPPMNSDAMYAVVTASPELVYTRTDDDILDLEIRRVDGSIQHLLPCLYPCSWRVAMLISVISDVDGGLYFIVTCAESR